MWLESDYRLGGPVISSGPDARPSGLGAASRLAAMPRGYCRGYADPARGHRLGLVAPGRRSTRTSLDATPEPTTGHDGASEAGRHRGRVGKAVVPWCKS